ncbi:MAG: aspartyl protease family protein [Thermoguttaceae bacterium]
MRDHKEMGRFSVEFAVANFRDVVRLAPGVPVLENVKHTVVSGVVDSGAARLVLPKHVADQLQLTVDGEVTVRYADHRQEKRPRVSGVWIELNGRNGVFSAVVEPNRNDALIGAIVLEELDLLVDCTTQSLYPRDPNTIVTEIE